MVNPVVHRYAIAKYRWRSKNLAKCTEHDPALTDVALRLRVREVRAATVVAQLYDREAAEIWAAELNAPEGTDASYSVRFVPSV